MSSSGYATPLRLEVGPVKALQRLYIAFFAVVTVVLWWLSLSYGATLILLPPLLWLAVSVWRVRPELGGSPLEVIWGAGGRWWLNGGRGEHEYRLQGNSYVSPYLVVLNFRALEPGDNRALVISRTAVGVEPFRRLQVRLRLERDGLFAD